MPEDNRGAAAGQPQHCKETPRLRWYRARKLLSVRMRGPGRRPRVPASAVRKCGGHRRLRGAEDPSTRGFHPASERETARRWPGAMCDSEAFSAQGLGLRRPRPPSYAPLLSAGGLLGAARVASRSFSPSFSRGLAATRANLDPWLCSALRCPDRPAPSEFAPLPALPPLLSPVGPRLEPPCLGASAAAVTGRHARSRPLQRKTKRCQAWRAL